MSKPGNESLGRARKAKMDEFYTQLVDISNELKHYKSQLHNKIILCNCDDPFESNFFKYFALNFNTFGLKKLIATSYCQSPIVGKQLSPDSIEGLKSSGKGSYAIEINEIPDQNQDGAIDIIDVTYLLQHDTNVATPLYGDNQYSAGDFRSQECIEYLKQADIVVTNPPFSLFRDYVAQLVAYEKQFLIIGNKNAIIYKEIFKLIKENKLWLGVTPMGKDMLFDVPNEYAQSMLANGKQGSGYKIVDGVVKARSPSTWFTNVDNLKRHTEIPLYRKYTPSEYPKYDNYDAIEVSRVVDIPMDYDKVMGVPISFLDKYSPEQFEIIGSNNGIDQDPNGIYGRDSILNGKKTFKQLFIKRRT